MNPFKTAYSNLMQKWKCRNVMVNAAEGAIV